jgi:hypothetical protein
MMTMAAISRRVGGWEMKSTASAPSRRVLKPPIKSPTPQLRLAASASRTAVSEPLDEPSSR